MDQEQMIATLSEYDFVAVIDASGSMATPDMKGGRTRWDYMQETMIALLGDLGKIDQDGIDVVVFGGDRVTAKQGVQAGDVPALFSSRRPMGTTPLAEALTSALTLGSGNKKRFIIVFTDGVPDDKVAAANVIVKQSNKQQTDDECTFLFIQVGNDATASAYLRKLDDDLKGAKFDIVDAITQAEAEEFASTAEMIVKAIND